MRGTRNGWLVVAVLLAASSVGPGAPSGGGVWTGTPPPADPPVEETLTRPNIVLILTDDQRADTLRYMSIVRRLLVRRGIRFDAGYVVNPVCCPSRTSILTGLYSHSTGVYTNRRPDGGFHRFTRDGSTIATWLHDAGYRTALIGKYLNQYWRTTYVPPGWDRWFASFGDGAYYDYAAVSDGTRVEFGSDPADYGTTVLRSEAVSFIRDTPAETPLFLYWAPHAPHNPAIPAPRDRRAFATLSPYRPPSYDEADVAEKPAWVRRLAGIDGATAADIDQFRLRQIRSLLAVDRAVAAIVHALRATDRLRDTMIVFMSDNGMLWGEHRWHSKAVPYEEAIAVPLVVRYDRLIDQPRIDDHLVLNIDLAPTFAELAGIETPEVEGRSFLELLESPDTGWRDRFLVEHLGGGDHGAPTFCAVHTERYVLVRYATGEEELYDLARDPRELVNLAGEDRFASVARRLRSFLSDLCDPVPAGLVL